MRYLYSLVYVFAIASMTSNGAIAAEACKPTQLKNPALTLAEIVTIATGYAKAWKPDAVVAQIANTTLGPLQPNGSSLSWHLLFNSESTKSFVAIDTFRGTLSCNSDTGTGGPKNDLKPDFMRDGAKLYAIAKENGDALLAQGYFVQIGTAVLRTNQHATWNISYTKDQGKTAPILILVNANTGVLEKIIKD